MVFHARISNFTIGVKVVRDAGQIAQKNYRKSREKLDG